MISGLLTSHPDACAFHKAHFRFFKEKKSKMDKQQQVYKDSL